MHKPSKPSLVIGRQPVIEAIHSGQPIERIYLQSGAGGGNIQTIRQLAREYRIPINLVPVEKLNSLSRANHQGCIAVAGLIRYMELQEVILQVTEAGELPLFVILDGVTDVRNIGAIARSAVCCGAQALIIPDKGVGALNEEAIKSSAGALEKIQVCRVNSLLKAIDTLHLNGIKVLASVMEKTQQVHQCNWQVPVAVIMGSEDKGIYPALLKAVDEKFTIPMAGRFDSLNVSVAAGIILYEAMKQRLHNFTD